VEENKEFCSYCGYKAKAPGDSKSDTKKAKNNNSAKVDDKGPDKRAMIFISIVAIILIGSGIYINYFTTWFGEPDRDSDGVPDSEDDFPKNADYSAKLEVIESNSYRLNNTFYVVLEFTNPKNFNIYWAEILVKLKDDSGSEFLIDSTEFWSSEFLTPDEHAFSLWFIDDPYQLINDYEIKIRSSRSTLGKSDTKPKIELLSHTGTFNHTGNTTESPHYLVAGEIKNSDESEHIINVWAAFFDKDHNLLDVSYVTISEILPEDSQEFHIHTMTPNADKIESYNIFIVIELI
jgi:hypothetical protein